ncbi:hypothetical protein AS889_02635 [Pseudomonas putida]|nr:hypothetical protein [Salmonella enterica subsp. enterica serovar Enteritidis]KWW12149.1 hypothetical protein AS889_02635 [Pseudomonas putida]
MSVVQGSINITDADQFGIFKACAGLFAGEPAPTEIVHMLNPVQYLWERVHPRKGRSCHIQKSSASLGVQHSHYLGMLISIQGRT